MTTQLFTQTETVVNGKKTTVTQFNFATWTAFVDAAENGETDMTDVRSSRTSNAHQTEWTLTKNIAAAAKLAREGWAEGAAQIKTSLETLHAAIPSKRFSREIGMAVTGPGTLDLGRYFEGHPEAWMVWQDREDTTASSKGPVVTIAFNITASGGVGTSEMIQKGSTIAALVDLLERSGRRVELILTCGTNPNKGHAIRITVRVKEAGDVLDIDRVAYALGHPSTLRRLGFSVWELAPANARKACNIREGAGYGRCEDWDIPDALMIRSSDSSSRNEAGRLAFLRQTLEAQGVKWEG